MFAIFIGVCVFSQTCSFHIEKLPLIVAELYVPIYQDSSVVISI